MDQKIKDNQHSIHLLQKENSALYDQLLRLEREARDLMEEATGNKSMKRVVYSKKKS